MKKEKSFVIPRGASLTSTTSHVCEGCLGNMVRNEYWVGRTKGVFVSLEHITPINRRCLGWEPKTRYIKASNFRSGLEQNLFGYHKPIWWKQLLHWLRRT